jgi:hypothetical protein
MIPGGDKVTMKVRGTLTPLSFPKEGWNPHFNCVVNLKILDTDYNRIQKLLASDEYYLILSMSLVPAVFDVSIHHVHVRELSLLKPSAVSVLASNPLSIDVCNSHRARSHRHLTNTQTRN